MGPYVFIWVYIGSIWADVSSQGIVNLALFSLAVSLVTSQLIQAVTYRMEPVHQIIDGMTFTDWSCYRYVSLSFLFTGGRGDSVNCYVCV